jgi:hypothetical protein
MKFFPIYQFANNEKIPGQTAIALKFGKSNIQQYVKSEQFLPGQKMARSGCLYQIM